MADVLYVVIGQADLHSVGDCPNNIRLRSIKSFVRAFFRRSFNEYASVVASVLLPQ